MAGLSKTNLEKRTLIRKKNQTKGKDEKGSSGKREFFKGKHLKKGTAQF